MKTLHIRGLGALWGLLAILGGAAPAYAGLYSLDEPFRFEIEDRKVLPMQTTNGFEVLYADLRDLNGPASKLTQDINARIQQRKRRDPTSFSAEELASYSTDLIRLNRPEAINLLQPLARDPRRGGFLVFAHLAVAHANRGEWREAAEQQLMAVKYAEFPTRFGRFTSEQLAWFKRLERDYYLPWLNQRAIDARKAKRGDLREEPDPLFPVQFVTYDGSYQPGKISDQERAKLPVDAIAIVQQMVIWHPRDTRLYWLLGELYNAEGDVETAYKILDACTFSQGYSNPILKEHRTILLNHLEEKRAKKAAEQAAQELADAEERRRTQWIVSIVVAGTLFLGYLQFREIRRRLRRRSR